MSTPSPPPGTAPVNREILLAEACALQELADRQRVNPLYYYQPHSKAAIFHRSRAPRRFITGGNRSGKTHSGVAEDCAYGLGYRPWVLRELGLPLPEKPWNRPDNLPEAAICFNTAGVRVQVPNDGFVVTGLSAKKGISEALWPKFKELLGPYISSHRIGHGGAISEVLIKNGSRVVFGSAEQDPKAFESTNYTWTHCDEPPPRAIWPGIHRGCVDQSAPVWFTFTPIGDHAAWIFHDFIASADGTKIFCIEVSIYDNPYLSREAIAEFENDPVISEAEREARLFGRFVHLSDVIYPTFNTDIHQVRPFLIPPEWPLVNIIDPHQVRPWFIAYAAISPRGDTFFFREWPAAPFHKIRRDARSIEDYALLLRQLDGRHPPTYRLIDPNAGPRQEMVRGVFVPSFVSELSRYDLNYYHKLNDKIPYGENLVRRLLAYNSKQPLSPINRPRLYFTDDCPNLIASMKYYTAASKPGTINEPHEEKRNETFKDGADCVRYLAVSGLADAALSDSYSAFDDNPYDPLPGSYGED